ncbi:MAG: DUF2892 domain-containing protein [Chthonomonadaceae bacterium]|nr:DUF2892 domain-containing protein [Chthonomonadaceae bacterium]
MSRSLTTSLTSPDPNVGEQERKLSMLGGSLLILAGLRWIKSPIGWGALAFGSGLIARGTTGKCALYSGMGVDTHTLETEGVTVKASVIVHRSADDLYSYWRKLENQPKLMSHLKSVIEIDETRSHWVACAPLKTAVWWDAEITEDLPGQRIVWRSTSGSQITNEGEVNFNDLGDGRGTEISVHLRYDPPAGGVGYTIAKLFGEEPAKQFSDDLARFKRYMENGGNYVTASKEG